MPCTFAKQDWSIVSMSVVPLSQFRAFPLEQRGESTCFWNSFANNIPRRTNLTNLTSPRTSLTKPRKMATLKMLGNGCEVTVPLLLSQGGESILKH